MRSLTALLSISFLMIVFADYSQLDCQPNEVFLQCGQCEGTCNNPRPVCDKECRGHRCECVAKKGFVRSKHGHCIRAHECPGPSIYSEDPYKFLRPYAKVSSIGQNLASYTDSDRDFRRPSDGIDDANLPMRNKKFFPVNSIRGKDIHGIESGFRRTRKI